MPANLEESGAFSPDFDAGEQSLASRKAELESLFNSQNASASEDVTSIPAAFLRVTVAV